MESSTNRFDLHAAHCRMRRNAAVKIVRKNVGSHRLQYGSILRKSLKVFGVWVVMAMVGCSVRIDWPEHRVAFHLEPMPADQMMSSRGAVNIEHATIGISSIELVPCETGLSVYDLLIPSAHAHGIEASETMLLRDAPIPLQTAKLGAVSPPKGRYCAVRVNVQACEGAPDKGSLTISGTVDDQKFTVQTHARTDIELPIDLELGSDSQHEDLVLVAHPNQWFDGVDPLSVDADVQILQNLSLSIEVAQ